VESQQAAAAKAKELANMMEGSRDGLRKALEALKSVRSATDSSRNAVQATIDKIGARGDPKSETSLWDAKQAITDHIEDLKAKLEARKVELHRQATVWAEVKTLNLENQRKDLEICIKNDDDAILVCETTLGLHDWEMSMKCEETAQQVKAATDQPYLNTPIVDNKLPPHLPKDLEKHVSEHASVPGVMFDSDNIHRTITLEDDGMVAIMTGGQGAYRATVGNLLTDVTTTGKVFWEVMVEHSKSFCICVGVCRPSIKANGPQPSVGDSPEGWMFCLSDQKAIHNSQRKTYGTNEWKRGDRVGVLLDFSKEGGSLQFLKNGQAMPGTPLAFQGELSSGPLHAVVEMLHNEDRVKLFPSPLPGGF